MSIALLLNGTAGIANSSRSINSEEIELFEQQGSSIDSFIFGQDAIAFEVAQELPLDSIRTEDLAKILKKFTILSRLRILLQRFRNFDEESF